MARPAIRDFLQVYKFWLTDISILDGLSLPVLNPLIGFSSITAPELTAEVVKIPEGNFYFSRKVITKADVTPIVLKRAARVQDRDFYNWIIHSITGESPASLYKAAGLFNGSGSSLIVNPSPRKNLLLIQFFTRNPVRGLDNIIDPGFDASGGYATGDPLLTQQSRVAEHSLNNFGGLFSGDLIPAKAYILYGCIPSRYKTSQDFDAKSAEVSIQELTLELEGFETINLL